MISCGLGCVGLFAVIINPFKKISQFLADVIDWRFWHDFVHEAGTPSNQHNYLAITWKGASPFEVWQ